MSTWHRAVAGTAAVIIGVLTGLGLSTGTGEGARRTLHDGVQTRPSSPAGDPRVPTAVSPPAPPTPTPQPTATQASPVTRPEPRPRPGVPTTIVVPRLGVSAAVVPISPVNRTLLPPSDPETIGWWSGGAQPGARRGSAVLTGHTVHTGGGAFDDLDLLSRGARVVVVTERGRLRYVVRRVENYPKQSLAAEAAEVFGQDMPGRLVLVTCEDWNGVSYLSNAVVVAAPA